VSIQDVNEPPTFAAFTSTTSFVVENSPEGTSVGVPVTATDPDTSDDGTLFYTLSQNVPTTRSLPTTVLYTLSIETANYVGAGTSDDIFL
jgi:hypothetical protein